LNNKYTKKSEAYKGLAVNDCLPQFILFNQNKISTSVQSMNEPLTYI